MGIFIRSAVSVVAAGLLATPVLAQNNSAASPPMNNAQQGGGSPANSLPAGAGTVAPTDTKAGAINTTGSQGTPPSAQSNSMPAGPSGSTTANPSAAFQQTVPQPAVK